MNKKKGGKKQSTAIAKSEKRKSIWAGAQQIMGPAAPGSKEAKERNLVLLSAKVLGVSPFGVNILGNLPYVNKLGLAQKAQEYTPGVIFRYEWIKYAEDDTSKAICRCKVVDGKEKDLSDWVIGECSPATIKMGTLKGYQNHIAQTRARNRAINEAYGVRIHEDMMTKLETLYSKKAISAEQMHLLGESLNKTSVEEIDTTSVKPIDPLVWNPVKTVKEGEASKDVDPRPKFECEHCNNPVAEAEMMYSKKFFKGKIYCRDCQKLAKDGVIK